MRPLGGVQAMRVCASIFSFAIVFMLIATGLSSAEGPVPRVSNVRLRINGSVNDALGRPLEGAGLILQTRDGKIMGPAISDKGGHFEFKQVTPGNYIAVAN